MAILETTLTVKYYDQLCQNRFNYLATGTPAAVTYSFGLTAALGAIYEGPPTNAYPGGTLLAALSDMIHNQVEYVSLVTRDVYSVTDFFEQPFVEPYTGAVSGTAYSPTTAFGFTSSRTRTDIRPGQKRFVGTHATGVADGGVIASAFLTTEMAAMATALGATLTYDDEGNTLTFTPCIVKKRPPGSYPDNPDQKGYAYYPTQTEQEANLMTSIIWTPKPQTRTQVSRQYGRGI